METSDPEDLPPPSLGPLALRAGVFLKGQLREILYDKVYSILVMATLWDYTFFKF
jgi:hypothetical protein